MLLAGYGTYADYFAFHDGLFSSVFDPGAAQRPQLANHYVASIQYTPKPRRPRYQPSATVIPMTFRPDRRVVVTSHVR